ncbi:MULTISPECIES: FHA domain-containing protein [Antrihabitans]|uniref:FHA domain-containing protein n=2 Tax=Antrihabitans TaxID=2799491 RepID=A0A934NQG9_9NOCA|nr:FHA domain-containing protein [Antrihabitans stalagmiti]MBJ8339566.1 FHA domain-containing protein [Antrihabitans stalagmiti]
MRHRYRPGGWPAVVCDRGLILLSPVVPPAVVLELYDALLDEASDDAVLALLEVAYAYVWVSREPGLSGRGRVAMRGNLFAELTVSGGERSVVRGRDRETSIEGPFDGALAAVTARLGDESGSSAVELPIASGVVLASEVSLRWEIAPRPQAVKSFGPVTAPAAAVAPLVADPMRTAVAAVPGGAAPAVSPSDGAAPKGSGPPVLALVCPLGHANPPDRRVCRSCSAPLTGDAREVRRPTLGMIRFSTGMLVPIDKALVIGARPSVREVSELDLPQLVTVPSAAREISRSHLGIKVDGWRVVALDLHSTNGSYLRRDGRAPSRIRPDEPLTLATGDTIDIGDGVILCFEDLP